MPSISESSSESEPQIFHQPQSLHDDPEEDGFIRNIYRTLSGASARRVNTQTSGALSVKDIYGDLDNHDIELRRQQSRSAVLDSLQNRVLRTLSNGDVESVGPGSAHTKELIEKHSHESDEELPGDFVATKDAGEEFKDLDPELVSWDLPTDPNNPRNWSHAQKLFQTGIVAVYSLISPMSSSVLSPAMPEISASLGITERAVESLCVSIMVLAWALGPLLIAPLSESDRVGRAPVLNVSIWITAIFNLACGFVKTPAQLCVLRFLGGLGGCAPLNVGAGTLADLWADDQRQFALSVYSLGPTLGPVLAPVISSFVVTGTSWHWCFFVLAIFNFAVAIFGVFFFRETYAPRILKKKAIALRKETGNLHLHTIYEMADGESMLSKLSTTVLRPILLLTGHPMVFGLGSFMAFTYGFMYLMIVTFPLVYKGSYGMSTNIAGLMYLPLGIGFAIGTVFFQFAISHTYRSLTRKNGGVSKPEFRLPWLCSCGVGIPCGLIIYGWSAQFKVHWIVPAIGLAIFGFFLVAMFQTIQLYLIDMNNRFAASSVAAAALFRSLFGFAFPLFAPAMYARLNYGWGNTLCALLALGLGVPFPLFCLFYGERLRHWANARFERRQARKDARNLEKLKSKEAE